MVRKVKESVKNDLEIAYETYENTFIDDIPEQWRDKIRHKRLFNLRYANDVITEEDMLLFIQYGPKFKSIENKEEIQKNDEDLGDVVRLKSYKIRKKKEIMEDFNEKQLKIKKQKQKQKDEEERINRIEKLNNTCKEFKEFFNKYDLTQEQWIEILNACKSDNVKSI